MLPPYVVYKATTLFDTWREGGPPGTRYNRTKSGWFDAFCFSDWFFTLALPYLRRLEGKKVMIGDNLASHLSLEVIEACESNDIHFVFLPANSTHLSQPLDVAFFRPLKMAWKNILESWKKGPGRKLPTIPKHTFPDLLEQLYQNIEANSEKNLKAGFKKCGIVPVNRNKLLEMIPAEPENVAETTTVLDSSLTSVLKELRYNAPTQKRRKKKLQVPAGKSVSSFDLLHDLENVDPNRLLKVEDNNDQTSETLEDGDETDLHSNLDSLDEQILNKWVIAEFSVPMYGNTKFCLGRVEEITGNGNCVALFLRETFGGDGKTFFFPKPEDRWEFEFGQVVTCLEEPTELSPGILKFEMGLSAY